MPDPNFLIIGAQKCGTSWLAANIKQHSDVFMAPRKEVHFFDKALNYQAGIKWYHRQFQGYAGQKAIGEATPNYFWAHADANEMDNSDHLPGIPERIHQHYPDLKLIVMLRDPVKRAISAYYHHILSRRIAPFQGIADAGDRYGVISMGFYHSQFLEWLKYFRFDQFLILIYEEDILKNKAQTLKKVFRFLDVQEEFKPADLEERHNSRPGHFYLYLNYYFPELARRFVSKDSLLGRLDFPRINVDAVDIEKLARIYKDENRKLESLIGRRVEAWTS